MYFNLDKVSKLGAWTLDTHSSGRQEKGYWQSMILKFFSDLGSRPFVRWRWGRWPLIVHRPDATGLLDVSRDLALVGPQCGMRCTRTKDSIRDLTYQPPKKTFPRARIRSSHSLGSHDGWLARTHGMLRDISESNRFTPSSAGGRSGLLPSAANPG